LIENINFVLGDINEFEANKMVDINFDVEMLSKSLMATNQVIVNTNEKETKNVINFDIEFNLFSDHKIKS
jgi:hypothetical protein